MAAFPFSLWVCPYCTYFFQKSKLNFLFSSSFPVFSFQQKTSLLAGAASRGNIDKTEDAGQKPDL
jgi:hypothetical protein